MEAAEEREGRQMDSRHLNDHPVPPSGLRFPVLRQMRHTRHRRRGKGRAQSPGDLDGDPGPARKRDSPAPPTHHHLFPLAPVQHRFRGDRVDWLSGRAVALEEELQRRGPHGAAARKRGPARTVGLAWRFNRPPRRQAALETGSRPAGCRRPGAYQRLKPLKGPPRQFAGDGALKRHSLDRQRMRYHAEALDPVSLAHAAGHHVTGRGDQLRPGATRAKRGPQALPGDCGITS